MNKFFFSVLLPVFILVACNNDSQKIKEIEGLEERLAAQFTNERSDSLVNLYRNQVKAHPDDHVNNLKYLSRAAEIQFTLRDDGVSAARWLDDALVHHSDGVDKAYAIEVYTRIWYSFNYKTASTIKLETKDIDKMVSHLQSDKAWIDTVLVRLDRQANKNGQFSDQAVAKRFLEVAEGYSELITDRGKYVELMMKTAGLAKSTGQFNKAVQLYSRISTKVPERGSTALFMQGFIYENDLKNIEKAKAVYETFLKEYPDDPDYTDDVRMSLKLLGKSPEEIVKSFENQ